jgi:hypothetical protein
MKVKNFLSILRIEHCYYTDWSTWFLVYALAAPITSLKYCHVIEWLLPGFGLAMGFIGHLQIVTTSNCSAIANSHALQFTAARTKSSQSAVISPVVVWLRLSTKNVPLALCPHYPHASATSFEQQQLTRTEPHQSSDSLTNQLAPLYSNQLNYLHWQFITPRHGLRRKHSSSSFYIVMKVSHWPRREHRFQDSPLVRVWNLLPSNGRCLQIHSLATGLRATIL